MSILEVENLTYYYPDTIKAALQGVNLQVQEGEFLLITGGSGSGKSSLARALAGLIPDFYGGRIGGRVLYEKQDIKAIKSRDLARSIGMVFQDPEKQLVMTGMEAEIAFGLENLGLSQTEMFRRVAEVMSFFDITSRPGRSSTQISGGQKQKLALASVMAMQPRVLILDEPTSQLDPLAAEELFNLIKRLNEELNITIILIEQRLERCFHLADRVAVMEEGRLLKIGSAADIAAWEVEQALPFVPIVAGYLARIATHNVPLTIKAGRDFLQNHYWQSYSKPAITSLDLSISKSSQDAAGPAIGSNDMLQMKASTDDRRRSLRVGESLVEDLTVGEAKQPVNMIHPRQQKQVQNKSTRLDRLKAKLQPAFFLRSGETGKQPDKNPLIDIKKLWFAYPDGQEALRGIDLSITAGECLAILGNNGSGKTTLLKQIAGIMKPGRGIVKLVGLETDAHSSQELAGMIGYLSQNPNDHLFNDTVEEELKFTQTNLGRNNPVLIMQLLEKLELVSYRHSNPRDLSSGERQRAALASVLAGNPRILLLDEPTRGIDYGLKAKLGSLLQDLVKSGVTVILVTHDVDFVAEYADRVVMIFDGRISCDGSKQTVLGSSMFYAPQMRKLFKGINDEIFNINDAVEWTCSMDEKNNK